MHLFIYKIIALRDCLGGRIMTEFPATSRNSQ